MLESYIQGFRMINALLRGLSPTDMDSLLTDEVRSSSLARVLQRHSQCERLNASPLALRNMALSAKAYALLPEEVRRAILNDGVAVQNLTAIILGEDPAGITFEDIADFVNDEAVMSVVFASEPASRVIADSETAMTAVSAASAAISVLATKQPALDVMKDNAMAVGKLALSPAADMLVNSDMSMRVIAESPLFFDALKTSETALNAMLTSNEVKRMLVESVNYSVFESAVRAKVIEDEKLYATPGTFTWIVPSYVHKVHVVLVGGGGAGSGRGGGGGGGALRFGNNIVVVPGQGFQVVVGDAGTPTSYNTGGDGQPSSFVDVVAGGGNGGVYNSTGTVAGGQGSGGDGGGSGGRGGGGGGGAGGYSGPGGAGGRTSAKAEDGAGGAGGGGYSAGSGTGGGGVGLYGEGESGAGGDDKTPAGGGSGGEDAVGVKISQPRGGGLYGGGGAGNDNSNDRIGAGHGAVRIIWGVSRAFPSTNVGKIV